MVANVTLKNKDKFTADHHTVKVGAQPCQITGGYDQWNFEDPKIGWYKYVNRICLSIFCVDIP